MRYYIETLNGKFETDETIFNPIIAQNWFNFGYTKLRIIIDASKRTFQQRFRDFTMNYPKIFRMFEILFMSYGFLTVLSYLLFIPITQPIGPIHVFIIVNTILSLFFLYFSGILFNFKHKKEVNNV